MITRNISEYIIKISNKFPVLFLTGPRQSGKTTLIRSLFPAYKYVSLENFDERTIAANDPKTFLKNYQNKGIIIDEAQHLPELFSYLQNIVDDSGLMGMYILTGSQNFLLLQNISQSLAGRAAVVNLFPFDITEIKKHSNIFADNNIDTILFTGLYPAIFDRNINPPDYYPSYLQTYIERDVRDIKNIGNLNRFRQFLQLCAGRVGQLLNLSSIGNEIGIDSKTVRSWISILEASFIIFLLPPYYKNYNKRIVKQNKLYFYDTGIISSLMGLNESEQLANFYLKGNLFENFVISEIMKQMHHNGIRPNLFFWRDNTGNEIDLIIDKGTYINAVEIKSGSTYTNEYFKNIVKFQKYSGIKPDNCYVIYTGKESYRTKDGYLYDFFKLEEILKYNPNMALQK